MKKTLLLYFFLLVIIAINGQTTHTITIENFSFNPSSLTIEEGDIVKFVNNEGTHWVDGTIETFSNNPNSFENESQSGTGWTYEETFNISGVYNYRCGIHSSMTGSITVNSGNPTLSIQTNEIVDIKLFPNPASDKVIINGNIDINNVEMYALTGEIIQVRRVGNKLLLDNFSKGIYFVKISSKMGDVYTKRLTIE